MRQVAFPEETQAPLVSRKGPCEQRPKARTAPTPEIPEQGLSRRGKDSGLVCAKHVCHTPGWQALAYRIVRPPRSAASVGSFSPQHVVCVSNHLVERAPSAVPETNIVIMIGDFRCISQTPMKAFRKRPRARVGNEHKRSCPAARVGDGPGRCSASCVHDDPCHTQALRC